MARSITVQVNARTAERAGAIVRAQLLRDNREYSVESVTLVRWTPDAGVALYEPAIGHGAAYRCTFAVVITR